MREPYPLLPTFVDELGEDELRIPHQWHTQSNLDDDQKAIEYRQKVKSLTVQMNEYAALASKYADRVKFGHELAQLLQKSIDFRSRNTSTECEGVSRLMLAQTSAKAD